MLDRDSKSARLLCKMSLRRLLDHFTGELLPLSEAKDRDTISGSLNERTYSNSIR